MTTLRIDGVPHDPLWSNFHSMIAQAMAPHAGIAHDADIYVAVADLASAPVPPPEAKQWALVWQDGQALTSLSGLKDAACRHHAVMELHLVERSGQEWLALRQAAFAVEPGDFAATASRALDRATRLVAQALIDLKNGIISTHISRIAPSDAVTHDRPFWRAHLIIRRLANLIERIALHENWMIGIVDAPIEQSLQWKQCPPVRWIGERSSRRYLADPFAWPLRDNVLLCETYDFATRMGSICQLTINGEAIKQEKPVQLNLPGHLSFPFLFEHEGQIFCLPESGAAQALTLLRWLGDDRWEHHALILKDVAAADSILFKYDGQFWIAYTDTAIDRFDNLNLLYASNLAGPWQTHANNPVRFDPRNARCGGTPFFHNGLLYRPAQDCWVRYGGAIRIMKIIECTPTRFHEEEVTLIAPETGMNPHGFHTLSACGAQSLVDGKRMIFSPYRIAIKMLQKMVANRKAS